MDTITDLNSLSAAFSYQEWFQVNAWASKQYQAFIFCNAQSAQTHWLIIKTSIYSEEAFIQGVCIYIYS